MALIDRDNFITHLVWTGLVDKATCGELKEAIELCTVKDIYTKDDMVAMLIELQLEIEELPTNRMAITDSSGLICYGYSEYEPSAKDASKLIQQKIDNLKGGK